MIDSDKIVAFKKNKVYNEIVMTGAHYAEIVETHVPYDLI